MKNNDLRQIATWVKSNLNGLTWCELFSGKLRVPVIWCDAPRNVCAHPMSIYCTVRLKSGTLVAGQIRQGVLRLRVETEP